MGVATGPGATLLTVIPVPASSLASTLVIASTAAFVATYAPYPGLSDPTLDDEKVTMRPPPPRTSRFAASRQHRNAPRAFTPKVRSHCSGVVSAMDGYAASCTPAAATRTCSSGPNAACAASNRRATCAGSDTSACTATARGPGPGGAELRDATS
uniref:Uncharacterized protein n=1 Tax=Arundo donax TaxID=35708 RepID=A0A0A9DLB2_ARUDO